MKHFSLLFFISLSFLNNGLCQSGAQNKDKALADYVGNYYVKLDPANRFVIRQEKENPYLPFFSGQHIDDNQGRLDK